MKHGTRSHRLGPRDFATGSDQSASDGQAALNQKPHGNRRRVPTARYQFAEECRFCGVGVEMKRLGIELLRERSDLLFVDFMCAAYKSLPDLQVFEVKSRLIGRRIHVRHVHHCNPLDSQDDSLPKGEDK
jgi:hypothetical protein